MRGARIGTAHPEDPQLDKNQWACVWEPDQAYFLMGPCRAALPDGGSEGLEPSFRALSGSEAGLPPKERMGMSLGRHLDMQDGSQITGNLELELGYSTASK